MEESDMATCDLVELWCRVTGSPELVRFMSLV